MPRRIQSTGTMNAAGPIQRTVTPGVPPRFQQSPDSVYGNLNGSIEVIQDDIVEIEGDIDDLEAAVGSLVALTLTGDVTGGPPVAGMITTVIAPLAVTNAKIANATILNAKISAIAGISLSKLQFMTDGTLVGSPLGLGGSVPQEVNGGQLIAIIEGSLGGSIVHTGDLGANVATFLANPTSGNLAAALTNETGSGLAVFNVGPAFLGNTTFTGIGGGVTPLLVTNEVEPAGVIRLIPGGGATSGGQILSLFAPNLGNGNRVFFALGKAWSSTNAAYFGFTRDATDANTVATIGHWGMDDIFKVYKSGGCAVGSASVDPGNTNMNIQGVYKKGNTQVVGARDTGWAAWSGLGNKTSKASNTATLIECAQTIKSILDAMIAHGLIGA